MKNPAPEQNHPGRLRGLLSGRMSGRLLLLLLLLLVLALIIDENLTRRPEKLFQLANGQIEMCLSCHKDEKLDPAHGREVLGCASCHLGNPIAIDKKEAHAGIVKNPGDLRVVEKTCGVGGCHAKDVDAVKNSLMATNRGILATLLYYWGEAPHQNGDYSVEELIKTGKTSLAQDKVKVESRMTGPGRLLAAGLSAAGRREAREAADTSEAGRMPAENEPQPGGSAPPKAATCTTLTLPYSLALDYYRKLCATCHLWKEKGDLEGFFGEKGGGCTACHFIRPQAPTAVRPWETFLRFGGEKKKLHPLIGKKVPMENCIRCHNRSGRVGTSYIGVYEGESYGTPYEQGGPARKELPGDRFFLDLPPDVHHARGMSCIDCHTRDEIMGDGSRHAHYEQALEISCALCHSPGGPGLTRKGKKLNNLDRAADGSYQLIGKLTGSRHPLKPPKAGICDYRGHKRLGCESCHSAWIPQCYGCHAKQDMRETHLDKLSGKETPGWWEEGRSYLRYERPMLGVWKDKVVTVTPGCQDIVTLIDKEGKPAGAFNSLTMAALNPHTTQKVGRSCADCHSSTKTIGLGEGKVWKEKGEWRFAGIGQGLQTEAGPTPPLDAYVDIEGRPRQKSARADLRPFNKQELTRILRVGQCLPCHKDQRDPVYRDYSVETKCPVFDEETGVARRN